MTALFNPADVIASVLIGQDSIGEGRPGPAPRQHDEYQFFTADMLTGRIVDEVTGVGQVQIGKQLDDAGAMSCVFAYDDGNADRFRAATLPGRTALYVVKGGQICWGGPIWTRRCDRSKRQVTLGGAEFFSYLQRLILQAPTGQLSVNFPDPGTDDNDIIRAWMALINAVHITPTGGRAGHATIQQDWNYSYAKVGQLIQGLAQAWDGPDVHCDVIGTIDRPQRLLRLGTPRLGRPLSESQLTFDDSNFPGAAFNEDASSTRTDQWGTGAGSENDQLHVHLTSAALVAENFPPLQEVSNYSTVTEAATLIGRTRADLALGAGVAVTFDGGAAVTGMDALTVFPGDAVRLLLRDPWFGGGLLDRVARVTGYRLTIPDDGGPEQMVPTFGDLVVT